MEITKQIILELKNEYSLIEAAKKLAISKSTLQRYCRKLDISFAKTDRITLEELEKITPEILQKYANSGKTIDEAAEELNISRSALANRLAQFNISFRKVKFNPEEYQILKNQGLKDIEISKIIGMSTSGLNQSKTAHNIEKQKRNFSEITEVELYDLYVNKKLSLLEITKFLNKGISAIYKSLRKFNIFLRREDGAHIKKIKIEDLYINQKKSIEEIAILFRVSADAIKKTLIRYSLYSEILLDKNDMPLNYISETQKQLIYGTILGDSYLGHSHSNSQLKIAHGFKQKEYVEYKYQLLKNYTQNSGIKIVDRLDKRNNQIYKAVVFKTIQNKIFTDIYPLFYKTNYEKYLNPNVVKELDARGLAIWYMDDGYKDDQHTLTICTESFLKEDLEKVKEVFKTKWDIDFELNRENRITFLYENALKFQSLISKYILPLFDYKLIDLAHQKIIKDKDFKNDIRDLSFDYKKIKITDIVYNIEDFNDGIRSFVEKYEWLQKVGNSVKWTFTARYQQMLVGVVLINEPNAYSTLLGEDTKKYEALIQRGCSASWAPKNLGSSFIMFSLNWMVKNTDKRLFIGYADPKASELGIIYQACNFDYLGNNFGADTIYQHPYFKEGDFFSRQYLSRTSGLKKWLKENNIKTEDVWFKENGFKNLSKIPSEIILKWKIWQKKILNESAKIKIPLKGKYVMVLGKNKTEQKYLNQLKNYTTMLYIKK